MATEFKHKITTPFAQNGTRTEIPQTSSDGSVSFDQGYTDLYSKKPSEGGKYVGRVPINYLFYLATAALKEIQEIIINGDIDALKKLQEDIQQGNIPVNMENARNILSVENGGTGTDNGFNFQNFMSISDIFSKFGMGESPSLQVFFEKLPNSCSFTSLVQGGTINAPFGGLITVIKFDSNSGYIKLNRFTTVSTPNEWTEAIAVMQGGKASSWKTIRDVNGFYTDCIARPNKVVMLSSDSAYEPNYQVGDIIYRYSEAGSNTNIFVPNSGTWIVECLMIFDRSGVSRVELGGSGIYEGGAKLDTNNNFNFRYRLTKIK